jgi:quinolinate synthase
MVVSYVNTSAAVKALTDVVVTSSNALKIVKQLPEDRPILFGPDQNLGGYINHMTGRKMDLWNGGCHVHARFSKEALLQLKEQYPNAKVLAHPECKQSILQYADVIGSTQALLNYAKEHLEDKQFVVATESGILHEMQKACPEVEFIPVPPTKEDTNLDISNQHIENQSNCNECEYMRMITLQKLYDCIRNESNEVFVDTSIAKDAILPIQRMLDMS